MKKLQQFFEKNQRWASRLKEQDPQFFTRLSEQQNPECLWIGCSDSRVAENSIVDITPGELFVHRNVANVVVHTDFNCLSVIEYAVDVLCVRHIIVCGHYGCGGVAEALRNHEVGLIDNWLRHIRDVASKYEDVLGGIEDEKDRLNRLCELNVVEQVNNVCHTTIVQRAWREGRELAVHGWIYAHSDGLLRDLGVCVTSQSEIGPLYRLAAQVLPAEI